ncbi:MAG: hypothetical protein HYU66_18820 [Armatimonadetes bacterium]|nr:hypothetical protein [Armatimonadota bacterium]
MRLEARMAQSQVARRIPGCGPGALARLRVWTGEGAGPTRGVVVLLLVAARLSAAPTIFWASDPVQPGDTVLVTGDGFGQSPEVEVVKLPDAPVEPPSGKPYVWPAKGATSAQVLQPGETSLKFALPAGLRTGQYAFRVSGPRGAAVGRLNRPALWWLQGDLGTHTSPGGTLLLFGHNLGRSATVLLRAGKGYRVTAAGDGYGLSCALPRDLVPGPCRVQVHNGTGGAAGWSDALDLTVARPDMWPATVFNVSDFGAEGNGAHDDTAAVQAALAKAGANGGGVVWFPRGRYQLTEPVVVPRFTVIRGERQELVNLLWPDFPHPPEALVRGSNSFAVEELTLYASSHRNVIQSDLGSVPDAGNVRLHRVRVRADTYRGHLEPQEVDERFRFQQTLSTGGGDTVRLGGANVVVTDCDLYGSGRSLYLNLARGGRVEHNDLYHGRWGWYCLEGSDGLIFADNRITGADLMSAGGGIANYSTSSSRHIYYARNQLKLIHGWDREAMTSDAGGGAYLGRVTAVNGAVTTLAADAAWGGRDWHGAALLILDGKGAGQWRRVALTNGREVTLDRPWDVPPDDTSRLSITMFHGRYLLVGNTFTDTGAMQFYGTDIECYVAGNTGTRMSGFHALGLNYYGYQPSWYCQFLGNTITEGSYYHWSSATDAQISFYGATVADYDGPLVRGGVLRGNRLLNNAVLSVAGSCRDVLIEGNLVEHSDHGLFISQQCQNVLQQRNTFHDVALQVLDEEAVRRANLERLKQYLGRHEPVLALDFDEAPGGKVLDQSGDRFHAGMVGGVTLADGGVKGKAAELDGTGYLRVEEPAVFNAPDVTVSLWVKPATLKGRRGLVAKRLGKTGAPFVIGHNGAAVTFEATDAVGQWSFNFGTGPVLKAGQWTHLAVVIEHGRGVTIYADGKPVGEKLNPADRASTSEPLILGREAWGGDPPNGATPGFFVGQMDQLRIWTRALSPAEVAVLALP